MNHRRRWRIGALASAVALLGSLATLEAHAVALGRITVQSALGESLRAEIDVSDLSAEEASSLRIGVASADVFKSAGFEYSALAASLDVKLQKRADGRSYLRLTGNRAVTDPFVDLIVEARWSSGRVTRDYTMLFDPPKLQASGASVVTAAPVLSRETITNSALPPKLETPAASPRSSTRVATATPKPAVNPIPPAERTSGARQVTVKPGDNASRIASQNKPVSVSLDQMLAALLRGNPEAFVNGNINLIRSGAVVEIPDDRAASALSPAEAKKTLVAQSKDFNTFRRKLADGLPATVQPGGADRQASGKIQARVDDRGQAVVSPDKLTLSKGAVQGVQSAEASAKDNAGRSADPSQSSSVIPPATVQGTTTAAPTTVGSSPGPATAAVPAGTTTVPAGPGAILPVPSVADTGGVPTLPVLGAASAPVPLPDASAPALAQAPVVSTKPVLVTPRAVPAVPSPIDWIVGNPIWLGSGLLLALFAGLGFVRYRKSQKSNQMDSSFLDSRLQPDSFFGASGGQRVDTSVSNAGRSSIAYSPSQLDAAGDVDPVAEADVYLAYGRDQQAEDILKEALRTYPQRIAIHTKLLEIFAKRRDNKAFENVALIALKLSGGQGPEWMYISQLGRQLEPGNSLFQPDTGGSDDRAATTAPSLAPLAATVIQDLSARAPASKTPPALDLDLDLTLGFALEDAQAPPTTPGFLAPAGSSRPSAMPGSRAGIATPSAFLDLDLNLDDTSASGSSVPSPLLRETFQLATPHSQEIDFLAKGLDFVHEPPLSRKPAAAASPPVSHDGMLEFDLNSLSLDLGPSTLPPAATLVGQENSPLEIKFLLAEEFRVLGDSDGARSLADEVVAKAQGPLKSKAQAFLNTLS